MQKITPCLWFDSAAEAAATLYTGLFPGGRILHVQRYGPEGTEVHGQPEGKVMVADFEIMGLRLTALNGGPHFTLNPSISLFVSVTEWAEAERLWAALSEGGKVLMPFQQWDWAPLYGWANDRFGVSWQVMLDDTGAPPGIAPCLMFTGTQAGRAEEAMNRYAALFEDSGIEALHRYDGSGEDPEGTVMHARFRLAGQDFVAMDSAIEHDFGFNEAVSLMVRCTDQAEIDRLWSALSALPEAERCGWLKDRFGVSWQIVPAVMFDLLADPDREKSGRAMQAMLKMGKLDIAALKAAHAGG